MKVISSLILLSTLIMACTAITTPPPISTTPLTSNASTATQTVIPSSTIPVEITQTPTHVTSNTPEPSPTKTITETPPEMEKNPLELTPRELFGQTKGGVVERAIYPDLRDDYYQYDGTENAELQQFFK